MTDDVDLTFLAKQNERILRELGSMRDELRVNSAMIQRCTNAITAHSEMLDAVHQWMIGINRKLEEKIS